jgi:hypothetical protein
MEIGHNVLHGQWDWMRDPKIHSTTWEWDNATPAEQWKHSPQRAAPHVHQRARQGQRPRLRHHARRRGPALAPDSTSAQPFWNFLNACFFEYGIAAYDLELGEPRDEGEATDPEFGPRVPRC